MQLKDLIKQLIDVLDEHGDIEIVTTSSDNGYPPVTCRVRSRYIKHSEDTQSKLIMWMEKEND